MTYSDLLKIVNHPDAFQSEGSLLFPEDCNAIKAIVDERYGVSVSLDECQEMWKNYSAEQDAQWLSVSSSLSVEICDAAVLWAKTHLKSNA